MPETGDKTVIAHVREIAADIGQRLKHHRNAGNFIN
jgi:hypothetical protein